MCVNCEKKLEYCFCSILSRLKLCRPIIDIYIFKYDVESEDEVNAT